jgi:hypothetical protein
MSEAIYEKVLKLLPLVPDGQFFFSCLFEPALHPRFVEYLEKIPVQYRKKVFFTTNLLSVFSDDEFRRLSRVSLHHLNISFDSLVPEVFELLRKGGKYDRFQDHLGRLVKAFSGQKNAPPLRFITVALRDNLAEIPGLVEYCARRCLSTFHEIRFVYEVSHLSQEWKDRHLLSNAEWAGLEAWAASSPFPCAVIPPPPGYYAGDGKPYSRAEAPPAKRPVAAPPSALQIDARGTVTVYGTDIHFDLERISHPRKFFRRPKKFSRRI